MDNAFDWHLTNRERQIVAALLRGFANKEIAQHLGVSDRTIKNDLTGLYRKTGVSGRVALAFCALNQRSAQPQ